MLNFLLYADINISGLTKGLIFLVYIVSKNVDQNMSKGRKLVNGFTWKNKVAVNKIAFVITALQEL